MLASIEQLKQPSISNEPSVALSAGPEQTLMTMHLAKLDGQLKNLQIEVTKQKEVLTQQESAMTNQIKEVTEEVRQLVELIKVAVIILVSTFLLQQLGKLFN